MLLGNNGKPWLNDSGCPDFTAYEALKTIQKEEKMLLRADKDAHMVVTIIKNILDLSGFELVDRIQMRHKKSGRIYK